MNVFKKFTRMSLRRNRTRTIVTVIGIVLSMALFTAVIEGAYSGFDFLRRSAIYNSGNYHGVYKGLTEQQAQEALKNDEIKDSASLQTVGWAQIGSQNEYKPYLLIKSASDNITDLLSVNLLEGRMPKNSSEIILPEHLQSNGLVQYKVGDVLTLAVGNRTRDGMVVGEKESFMTKMPEEIINTQTKVYTVVGTYLRFDTSVEGFSCPGYTALTVGGGNKNMQDILFTSKHPASFDKNFAFDDLSEHLSVNSDLLDLYGNIGNSGLRQTFFGFAAVLILLIAVGSISLIYNSFSISVSERTKQFGILKSVGATKKQIRLSVLYEALLLCAIAIPIGLIVGCAGIGITLWCLRDSFSLMLNNDIDVQMRMALNLSALLAAVVICLVTTLVSAWLPAKKAIKINPIEAIRQSDDIKIKGKDVKSSKLVQKLFGFEGTIAVKNFKRNRKRYRSTILSLALSIALFISAASFCSYLGKSIDGVADNARVDSDITCSFYDLTQRNIDAKKTEKVIRSSEGVEDLFYCQSSYQTVTYSPENLSGKCKPILDKVCHIENDGKYSMGTILVFYDDNTFNDICKKNGIDSAQYYDKSSPRALVYNYYANNYFDEEAEENRWFTCEPIKESALPFSAEIRSSKKIDGYTVSDCDFLDDGTITYYYYYPDDYLADLNFGEESLEPDRAKAIKLSAQEAVISVKLDLDRAVTDVPVVSYSQCIYLIYPYSIIDCDFMQKIDSDDSLYFYVTAPDHEAATKNISNNLVRAGIGSGHVSDNKADYEAERTILLVVNVFSYGFIILISLIAVANVFNTISTNVLLRRREFAMLKSVGLTSRGFKRMTNYECLIYGLRGLLFGLPAAFIMTFIIYTVTGFGLEIAFFVPWSSVAIAVASVFLVVFITMLYATSKIKKDNPIDALKKETL